MKYRYFLLNDSKLLVRHSEGLYEKYVNAEWIEDHNLSEFFTGDIPCYREITEEMAAEQTENKDQEGSMGERLGKQKAEAEKYTDNNPYFK